MFVAYTPTVITTIDAEWLGPFSATEAEYRAQEYKTRIQSGQLPEGIVTLTDSNGRIVSQVYP